MDTEAQRGEIRADPLYGALDVATEGRDVFLVSGTDVYGGTNVISVLSLPLVLDRLVPMLAAAIDGDPYTGAPE